MYNFARYMQWPAHRGTNGESESIEVCLIGDDSFGTSLRALEGRRLGTRTVGVRRPAELESLESCHLLFVAGSEQRRFTEIIAALDRRAILTVSEARGFLESGGVINFVIRDNKVRFIINL